MERKKENRDTTDLMSMFNSAEEKKQEVPDTAPDFSSFLNLANGQEEKKEGDDVKVEFF